MTGFTGFENLFRPLHSPLLFVPLLPFLSVFAAEIMKGRIQGAVGMRFRKRVIAVTPEPLQRAKEEKRQGLKLLM